MKVILPIAPAPKERPRFANGRVYTPNRTKWYEEAVQLTLQAAKIRPVTGAVSMTVTFYLTIPKSWQNAKKQLAKEGKVRPTTKPDIDNLAKAIMDGCNGLLYNDDKQVVDLTLRKFYGEPRTEIEWEEI